jgi:hypothetical protein
LTNPGRYSRRRGKRQPAATSTSRNWIDTRERQYLTVYREVLGFAYLVLAR